MNGRLRYRCWPFEMAGSRFSRFGRGLGAELFEPFTDDFGDFSANLRVFDSAATVALTRADVNHGVKFDEIVIWVFGIEVNSPEVVLERALFKHKLLDIGVHIGINTEKPFFNIDDTFDHGAVKNDARR